MRPHTQRTDLPVVDTDVGCHLIRIEGRAQGVGFREACVQRARTLGLTGYVRNRRDGSVEVMLQGPADGVTRMQAWLHEGPPRTRVDRLTVSSAPVAMLSSFERRPTE